MRGFYKLVTLAFLLFVNVPLWSQKADDYREKANQGDKEAQYYLGGCYAEGLGVANNIEQAIYWWTKSAEQGYAQAQFNLGTTYLDKQNYKQAMTWLLKAAEQDHPDADFNLAIMYQQGLGVEKDDSKVIYWLTKSAAHGNKEARKIIEGITMRKEKGDNGKWGFLDKDGTVVIPFVYDFVGSFSNESIHVDDFFHDYFSGKNGDGSFLYVDAKKDGKYGIIDKGNNILIPFEYENLYYSYPLIKARKGEKFGYIDERNKVVIPFEYDAVVEENNGFYKVRKINKWGVIDKTNHVVVPIEYEEIKDYKGNYTQAKKNGKWGTIDKNNHFTEDTDKGKCVVNKSVDENGQIESITFQVNSAPFVMRFVEGGSFQMGGNDSDARTEEKPIHNVKVNSFYVGSTEVTQWLWRAVMDSNPSNWKGNTLPVESVSWEDCQEFIRKLNELTGQKFRLPTEAEWEYAARGGKKSKGYKYSGSNKAEDVAWYIGSNNTDPGYKQGPHVVNKKLANELGLYDMSGNVWEWCEDWYGSYSGNSQTNPKGPTKGTYHVVRGGSWFNNDAKTVRVSSRLQGDPDDWIGSVGLRLCLPAEEIK